MDMCQLHQHQRAVSPSPSSNLTVISVSARKLQHEQSDAAKTLNNYFTKMENDLSAYNRVMQFEVVNIMRLLKLTGKCSYSQSLSLIKSCGEALVDVSETERTQMLDKCMKVLSEADVKLNIAHYNACLKVIHEAFY